MPVTFTANASFHACSHPSKGAHDGVHGITNCSGISDVDATWHGVAAALARQFVQAGEVPVEQRDASAGIDQRARVLTPEQAGGASEDNYSPINTGGRHTAARSPSIVLFIIETTRARSSSEMPTEHGRLSERR
jgi:hypothetical protein